MLNCTKFVEQRLPCGQAKPEVGYGCNRIQSVWAETVSFRNGKRVYRQY